MRGGHRTGAFALACHGAILPSPVPGERAVVTTLTALRRHVLLPTTRRFCAGGCHCGPPAGAWAASRVRLLPPRL